MPDHYPTMPPYPDHILHDPLEEEEQEEVDDDSPAHS